MLPLNNDLNVRWTISRMGEPENFKGKQLRVFLTDPNGRRFDAKYVREDSVLLILLTASQLTRQGDYTLTLEETDAMGGKSSITVVVGRFGIHGSMAECSIDGWLRLTSSFRVPEPKPLPKVEKVVRVMEGDPAPFRPGEDDGGGEKPDVPVYDDRCWYGYMDGIEQDELSDAKFFRLLQREAEMAALAVADGEFESLEPGVQLPGKTLLFEFQKDYLWILTPITHSDFIQGIEVSTGFAFPFEMTMTVTIGRTKYHARRSNGFEKGEIVMVKFT